MSGVSFQSLMSSTGVSVPWVDTYSVSLSFNSAGWGGYTLRQIIPSSLLSTDGTTLQLFLRASSTASCTIDAIYIGLQAASGDLYDMAASAPAPTQLFVGGSGTFTIGAGQTINTDALVFAIDHTKTYIVSVHFSSGDILAANSVTGSTAYNKAAVNEAATADVSGYATIASSPARLVTKIQVHS